MCESRSKKSQKYLQNRLKARSVEGANRFQWTFKMRLFCVLQTSVSEICSSYPRRRRPRTSLISRKKPRKARKSKRWEKTNICFFVLLLLCGISTEKGIANCWLSWQLSLTKTFCSCHLKILSKSSFASLCCTWTSILTWGEILMNWPLKGPSWRSPKGSKEKTSFATETQRRIFESS